MFRLFFFFVLFVLASNAFASDAVLDFKKVLLQLKREAVDLKKLYKKAESCFPEIKNNKNIFCTGLVLSEEEAKSTLNMSFESCSKKIAVNGYQTYVAKKPKNIKEKEFNEFMSSTQNALTFHEEKVILFKKNPNPLTCVHEYLHVLQRSKRADSSLAPELRQVKTQNLVSLLNKAVEVVEKEEKAGNLEVAKRFSNQLQPILEEMNRWHTLVDLLDEKDVHGWLWLRCRSLESSYCSSGQLDVAVANLWKRKDFVPQKYHQLILEDGIKISTKK